MIKPLFMTLVFLFLTFVHSDEFSYVSGSPFHIGACIDPSATESSLMLRKSAVIGDKKKYKDNNFELVLELVDSREELYEKTGLDLSLSAKSTFASASAKINMLNSFTFDTNSVVWMVKVYKTYEKIQMENLRLKKEAKSLIDKGMHEKFITEYGTHYIYQETEAVAVSAIFMFNSSNKSKIREVRAAVSAACDWGDLDSNYESTMKNITKRTEKKIKVVGYGGEGIHNLTKLVSFDSLEKTKEILTEFIQNAKKENSVPAKYLAMPIKNIDSRLKWSPIPKWRDRYRKKLYLKHCDAKATIKKLRNAIANEEIRENQEQLKGYLRKYEDVIDDILDLAEECDVEDTKRSDLAGKIPDLPYVICPIPPNLKRFPLSCGWDKDSGGDASCEVTGKLSLQGDGSGKLEVWLNGKIVGMAGTAHCSGVIDLLDQNNNTIYTSQSLKTTIGSRFPQGIARKSIDNQENKFTISSSILNKTYKIIARADAYEK